jgi:hypothetical protein
MKAKGKDYTPKTARYFGSSPRAVIKTMNPTIIYPAMMFAWLIAYAPGIHDFSFPATVFPAPG